MWSIFILQLETTNKEQNAWNNHFQDNEYKIMKKSDPREKRKM